VKHAFKPFGETGAWLRSPARLAADVKVTHPFTYFVAFTSDEKGSRPVSSGGAAVAADVPAREAVVVALDVIVRELEPLAATFFDIGNDGEARIRAALPSDPSLDAPLGEGVWPSASELAAEGSPIVTLDAVRRGPGPRSIGAVDDLRLLIRDGERLVAGISVWRGPGSPGWSPRQLRFLASLQPLIEMAYVAALRVASSIDARLPATLTRRQHQVARMLAAGATNAEVARALNISADTAKSHTRAVLAKVGAASRRELLVKLNRHRADAEPAPGHRDETAGRVLSLVLGWAAERIGAAAGGCALFSARLELAAQACDTARTAVRRLDRERLRRVQRQLFPSGRPAELLKRALADRPRSPVLELDLSAAADADADAAGALVAKLGLAPPLVTVLRLQGRVAAVIWLCGEAGAGTAQRERARALRVVHPLLELACATPLAAAHAPVSTVDDLEERGLTPREATVATLALSGQSNADIAATLQISQSTVKQHMTRVLAKCGVRSRTQLIALFADGRGPAGA
jgi:DNA-binding CsgD family transcriptional regulator